VRDASAADERPGSNIQCRHSTTTVEPEELHPHIRVELNEELTAQGGNSMSSSSTETGDISRTGARASRETSTDAIEPEETDEADVVLIERRLQRRVQKKRLIAQAQRILNDAPSRMSPAARLH
jgi:hypothetical protein